MSEELFSGTRSDLSFAIIQDQVFDVGLNYAKSGYDFDEDNADWLVLPKYRMPDNWRFGGRYNPILIMFPTEYPTLPPVGFYLPDWIRASPNGHLYRDAYHKASERPLAKGWQWYCVYVNDGAWLPAKVRNKDDWRRGDNLWTYMQLIDEALASLD